MNSLMRFQFMFLAETHPTDTIINTGSFLLFLMFITIIEVALTFVIVLTVKEFIWYL